ncbi:DNA 3'-phosphatase [Candidozyma auris]|nr:DNA 3'-phosphatase [[Candida] auris]
MSKDIASMLGGSRVVKKKIEKKKLENLAPLVTQSFSARWKVYGSHCITNFPRTDAFKDYVVQQLGQDTKKLRLATFDLDGTLTQTKTGGSFARGPGDWRWFSEVTKSKVIQEIIEKKFILVIFTNQGGVIASEDDKSSKSYLNFKERVNQVVTSLGKEVPYPLVVAAPKRPKGKQKVISSEADHERMRKPATGMFETVCEYFEDVFGDVVTIDKSESFYVGDAAGREQDFSDSDKKFAEAIGLPFYTPEEFYGK